MPVREKTMNRGVPDLTVSIKGQYIIGCITVLHLQILKFEFIMINRIFQSLTFLSSAVLTLRLIPDDVLNKCSNLQVQG